MIFVFFMQLQVTKFKILRIRNRLNPQNKIDDILLKMYIFKNGYVFR